MKDVIIFAVVLATAVFTVVTGPAAKGSDTEQSNRVTAEAKPVPSADEQVASLEAMCAENAQAMKNLGYGENEINETVCALVSLRDQVVLPQDSADQAASQ